MADGELEAMRAQQQAAAEIHAKVVSGKEARCYRVRRGDELVECESRPTGSGWAFQPQEQALAQAIVDEIENACRYFWERPVPDYYGCPEIEGVSDEEVERRIRTFNQGENTREAKRVGQAMFDLEALPRERQRALIERVERLKAEWGFAWLD